MKLQPKKSIYEYFSELEDPRVDRTKRHKLIDIIIITICAVICSADTWVDIEAYGESKYEWLKSFLELPNGIPSHDTFARVFARLDPEQLQQCFLSWIQSVSQITQGEIIAIDGKTLRGSYDKKKSQKPIHMVSAGATANRLVLGQVKVDNKSNEITAIPQLLKVLSLSGCLVTIDAMGCQKEIVKQITEQQADYVITLKKNQGYFYQRVEKLLNELSKNKGKESTQSDYCKPELAHGRQEYRYYYMASNIAKQVDPGVAMEKSQINWLCRLLPGRKKMEKELVNEDITLVVYQIMPNF